MTEGPTSATSMWTSEPRQTQKRGQGRFSIVAPLPEGRVNWRPVLLPHLVELGTIVSPSGFLPGVSCPSLSDDRS